MNEWIVHQHSEMREWITIFDYIFQRGRVGSSNGITFVIHTKENGHNSPHLHARYQDKEAVIGIPNGEVISGTLPTSKLKKASTWVRNNRDYLEKRWDELVDGVVLFG